MRADLLAIAAQDVDHGLSCCQGASREQNPESLNTTRYLSSFGWVLGTELATGSSTLRETRRPESASAFGNPRKGAGWRRSRLSKCVYEFRTANPGV